jgi:tRNA (guanine-N7-)-methyltransferase
MVNVQYSRLYGRQKGRPLHKRKAELVQVLLPRLTLDPAILEQPIAPTGLFPHAPQTIWLEIGFGGGEHLAAQAAQHPDYGFIGCEPFLNGIASLLDHLDRGQQTNVRIWPQDAALLLAALPPASISRCYLLFADPWPKARHAKRRFIKPDSIALLARALRPGAELIFATDHQILAEWVAEQMAPAVDFRCVYDSDVPPADWIATRYEAKGRAAGRMPVYRIYRRF